MENEPASAISETDEKDLLKTLRCDLRAVKNAGLKVGYLGTLTGAIIVSVSCRIGRLGISEEAMRAWNVRASEYLVLLIRYPGTYVHFQKLLALGNAKYSAIQFHVGLCDSYKPTAEDAIRAFQGDFTLPEEGLSGTARLRSLFIEQPLDSLLNERFLRIMELRYHLGLSWTGAELYIQQNQGRKPEDGDLGDAYFEPDTWSVSAPALFQADQIGQGLGSDKLSLPLIAMQFTLRHFVKCTEFCLVCHCKIRDSFEAIKPYVCSNGLCLFQYMALGMGPSLEHEIQFQPSVVDLLISLTYARAVSGRLADLPAGLGLRVPGVLNMNRLDEIEQHLTKPKESNSSQVPTCYSGNLVPATMACRLDKHAHLKPGDWVAIFKTGTDLKDGPWHCRVQDIHVGTCGVQLVQLSSPVVKGQQLSASKLLPGPSRVKFIVYERNFDDLDVNDKRAAVRLLLDTLPNVDKMKAFLTDSDNKRLAAWRDVISPAALDVLRWVVASNRSFIMEDDTTGHSDYRVTGMESYKQFRLVQGAPDKEQRFRAAVAANAAITKTDYPTIFAWHGSPVYNWHSILREGLHFKEITNGRAYGDGVYLSNKFHTSVGFAPEGLDYSWPQSNLKIRMLVSLNELVNAPTQFKHTNPHYVITQLDWIQPRYLFVKCQGAGPGDGTASAKPPAMYKQDPQYPALGPNGTPIYIPISALNSQRRHSLGVIGRTDSDLAISSSPGKKKRKRDVDKTPTPDASKNSIVLEDDVVSVATAFDDLQILLSEDEGETEEPSIVKPSKNSLKSDFEPGTLKKESLPLLTPPQYATTPATKILQQHLRATLKVQAREPLHDLGWYIDPNFITTVYQWIVELHSFDPKLPLAKDLKQANMKTVVLELRFPPGFPMSPPFVRVIRPRFLEFANGGGGHVTAGGAMCMELLTNSGWLPTASIESVLLQVRMAITNTEPRPARLALNRSRRDYSVGEAVEAYKRACLAHGWQIPEDIQRLSWA
jgi:ubiquitin-conjugating enzyme E2 Q